MTIREFFDSTVKQIEQLQAIELRCSALSEMNKYQDTVQKAIQNVVNVLYYVPVFKKIISGEYMNFTKNSYIKKPLYESLDATFLRHKDKIAIAKNSSGYFIVYKVSEVWFNGVINMEELPEDHPYFKYNTPYDFPELAMIAYYVTMEDLWDCEVDLTC